MMKALPAPTKKMKKNKNPMTLISDFNQIGELLNIYKRN